MILLVWSLSKSQINKWLRDLFLTNVSTTIYDKFSTYLVEIGKEFMTHKFEVDYVNPESNTVLISTTRKNVMLTTIKSLSTKQDDERIFLELNQNVRLNSELLTSITYSEYGKSGVPPYPLLRSYFMFLNKNAKKLFMNFIADAGALSIG